MAHYETYVVHVTWNVEGFRGKDSRISVKGRLMFELLESNLLYVADR